MSLPQCEELKSLIKAVIHHSKWMDFLLTTIPHDFIAQMQRVHSITVSYDKLEGLYNAWFAKAFFRCSLSGLNELCYDFLNLTAAYFEANQEDCVRLTDEFDELTEKFISKVDDHQKIYNDIQVEALLCFEDMVSEEFGPDVLAYYQITFKKWMEGALATDKMLQHISVLFSGCPYFVDKFNGFLDTYRVEYKTPNYTTIYHPCGNIQIFRF